MSVGDNTGARMDRSAAGSRREVASARAGCRLPGGPGGLDSPWSGPPARLAEGETVRVPTPFDARTGGP
ncbi:hypothetical protein [Streptomyces albireticuli]|uniref:hypothetical protein n=1 Tax=Streptomyces albireticuli TaxID=1940 RepID=UPI00367C4CED